MTDCGHGAVLLCCLEHVCSAVRPPTHPPARGRSPSACCLPPPLCAPAACCWWRLATTRAPHFPHTTCWSCTASECCGSLGNVGGRVDGLMGAGCSRQWACTACITRCPPDVGAFSARTPPQALRDLTSASSSPSLQPSKAALCFTRTLLPAAGPSTSPTSASSSQYHQSSTPSIVPASARLWPTPPALQPPAGRAGCPSATPCLRGHWARRACCTARRYPCCCAPLLAGTASW